MTTLVRRSRRDADDRAAALAGARLAAAAGVDPDVDALDGRARRAVALSRAVGAPVGAALAAAAQAAEDDADLRRELHVATAQARVVAGGLVALPLLLVPGLDVLLGVPLLGFYATGAGRAVLAVAGTLLACGALVAWRLVARVARPSRGAPDDEVADLLAQALAAGLPAPAALRAVARQRGPVALDLRRAALAIEHDRPPALGTPVAAAAGLLARAERLGAPAAPALRDLAHQQRREARAVVRARAEQLGGQLTVPSVLLLLPATVLLVGAPIVHVGLSSAP